MSKRDVKQEILTKLNEHPLYKQVLTAVSGSQKELVEKKVYEFVNQFAGSLFENLDKVDDKKELLDAIRKRYVETANNVVVKAKNVKKSS